MIHFITTQKNDMSVETAMRYVSNYIELKELSAVSGDFQYYLMQEEYDNLLDEAENLGRKCVLLTDTPIHSGGFLRKVKILIKKVIRKSIQWYIRDITEQQAEINECYVRCMNQEINMMKQMMAELKELRMLCSDKRQSDNQDK